MGMGLVQQHRENRKEEKDNKHIVYTKKARNQNDCGLLFSNGTAFNLLNCEFRINGITELDSFVANHCFCIARFS